MFTDRVSSEGNAIGSVRPSVCFHYIFWTDWPLTSVFCKYMDHDHSLSGTKDQGHGSRSKVKMRSVGPRVSTLLVLECCEINPDIGHVYSEVTDTCHTRAHVVIGHILCRLTRACQKRKLIPSRRPSARICQTDRQNKPTSICIEYSLRTRSSCMQLKKKIRELICTKSSSPQSILPACLLTYLLLERDGSAKIKSSKLFYSFKGFTKSWFDSFKYLGKCWNGWLWRSDGRYHAQLYRRSK